MALRVIVLEHLQAGADDRRFRVAFWLDVPVAQRSYRANAAATSAYAGASAAELAALRDGSVVERVEEHSWAATVTMGQIRNALQARWNALQAEVNADRTWARYGTRWDGTAWAPAGTLVGA